jgi:maltooligosyltrehalose trehalohydrolase
MIWDRGPSRVREPSEWNLDLGARPIDGSQTLFRVWAPYAATAALRFWPAGGRHPEPVPMQPQPPGYFEARVPDVGAGTRYKYLLDGTKERPDPASRFQPEGVHGPSEVIDPESFHWTDRQWTGPLLEDLIIYELHPGTFTEAGTFDAIIPHLRYLRNDLGITAIEVMPVGQFPGTRNWGYDGVYLFAPQASYGGPGGLKRLVDACHALGLAVILDVVYNHLGPEGNYLNDFGPYFTDRYRTPWGPAINYDGPDCDPVRHFVISNALYWLAEYHFDGLRLDAVHGIFDCGATHILRELSEAVHAFAARCGRRLNLIAESDLNDVRIIAPPDQGGYGMDAQWNDDFHHALHTVLTGERAGYYQDFGRVEQLATAVRDGFVYAGQRSAFRRRRHGNSARGRPASQFIVYAQNHDQVGNRALGDRLTTLVPFDALKVAAAAVLLGPNVPLLFMGEEYGERAPFLYFTDHGDPALVEAVRRGRRAEFEAFGWPGEVPDPQDLRTFERSRLAWPRPVSGEQHALLQWYRRLIELRKTVPALGAAGSERHGCRVRIFEPSKAVVLYRTVTGAPSVWILLGLTPTPAAVTLDGPQGSWSLALDSRAKEFGGPGEPMPPRTVVLSHAVPAISIHLPPFSVLAYVQSSPDGT